MAGLTPRTGREINHFSYGRGRTKSRSRKRINISTLWLRWLYQFKFLIDLETEQRKRMIKAVRYCLTLLTALLILSTPTNSKVSDSLFIIEPATLSLKPDYFSNITYSNEELECLALNIYFEAGVESTAGKLAVANVTLNRKNSSDYPNTICSVVKEGKHYHDKKVDKKYPLRDRCQFSWYCDGLVDKPKKGRTWDTSLNVAEIALKKHYADILIDITDGSTHYHANWMEKYPSWAYTKKKMATIDRHIFYKSKKYR